MKCRTVLLSTSLYNILEPSKQNRNDQFAGNKPCLKQVSMHIPCANYWKLPGKQRAESYVWVSRMHNRPITWCSATLTTIVSRYNGGWTKESRALCHSGLWTPVPTVLLSLLGRSLPSSFCSCRTERLSLHYLGLRPANRYHTCAGCEQENCKFALLFEKG